MVLQDMYDFFHLIGCMQDQYYVRAYDGDDTQTIFVNQNMAVSVAVNVDSGYVNVTGYLVNGLNYFTFIDYNGPLYYRWNFELKKNSEIIFNFTCGYNNDTSKPNQNVYYNTVSLNITLCN